MHITADDLLKAAYTHISTNGNDADLSGEEMMKAFKEMDEKC